jgi:outer membrane lipoprotein SlyB
MRILAALLVLMGAPAWAQVSTPAPAVPARAAATCPDCGVVRSVRVIKRDIGSPNTTEGKPSGLVATIPLGKGGGKPQVGSSSRIGADKVVSSETWEVAVRLDDGRFRILTLDDRPDFKEGDKVRVDAQGRLQPRD